MNWNEIISEEIIKLQKSRQIYIECYLLNKKEGKTTHTYFLIIVKETLKEKTDNNELVVSGGGRKLDGGNVKGVSLLWG